MKLYESRIISATTNLIYQTCTDVEIRPTDRININAKLSD